MQPQSRPCEWRVLSASLSTLLNCSTFESKLPYNVVDVLLQEGVHFVSEVLDCPPEEIRAGMTVEAVFVPASDEITLVKFRRSDPRLRPGSGTDSEGAAR